MYTNIALAALASVAAAMPAPQAGTPQNPLKFGGLSLSPGSPIHLGEINANNQEFVIGAPTKTAQPDNISGNYNTNQTIFSYVNYHDTLNLYTADAGGQRVYVTQGDDSIGQVGGQLRFVAPHSVETDGPAIFTGFANVPDATLQFEKKDWVACPDDLKEGAYVVYAASRYITDDKRCVGFTWKLVQLDDNVEAAWQYTK
ncbi:hypothetical protein CERZMDRAFT_86670 [Cercospora zeae-maydis SCOH1-5]|uniref:Ubiquitin 3 binding protein But2 C-terminal domain-containing protein n=1 Tax=Cercospora zeae-maydis SCOH1-5 TaxID=717836 RepID=A0A6A6F744_9PEZI|nr:hypothetical protein CERZMDRAFT_86670 [Cercospora zeae-maydis SCOH1-5]